MFNHYGMTAAENIAAWIKEEETTIMSKTFDPTKPVQTKGGLKARIVCADVNNANYSIIALVYDETTHRETAYGFDQTGRKSFPGSSRYSDSTEADLINIPERRSEWMNVWNDPKATHHRHEDVEGAKLGWHRSSVGRMAILRFDFEDDKLVGVEIES